MKTKFASSEEKLCPIESLGLFKDAEGKTKFENQ
jgi:hypothetical protein